ncbi:MAG: 16S rRNA (adenine(1518)-N(6)/adenine(1519)-N(6))-dimethyltransferase RsmA [Candidatus Marisimplicoccus sp.]
MVGNVHPKKFLGQHFLIDENISKKIIDSIDFSLFDKVIEVGPGKGALTKYLFNLKENLTLIEIDKESILFLEKEFKNENFEIIEKDFLKFNIPKSYPLLSNILIIGNFPYNISSQILFKAIDDYNSISCLVGMFQKEVAERIVSEHNTKKYGILSVKTQLLYDVKILFNVSPNVFFPKPKVDSAVISMTRKKNITLDCDLNLLDKVIKLSFQQRRKKLKNSLKRLDIQENILEDSIFGLRPEQLSVEEFVKLTQKISDETI